MKKTFRRLVALLPLPSLLLPAMLLPAMLAAQPVLIAPPSAPPSTPPVAWQPPRLIVAGAESPIVLQSVHIAGEVRGRHAETRIDMLFRNPNQRVLEGELQFPLLNGQRIAGFAMDVNGVLREAVPVDKARGQAVFEDIVRGNVDPGLLEATQGNNFKLRVYPLPAGGVKRVVLRIAETLPGGTKGLYRVPLGFAERIGELAVDVQVSGAADKPAAASRALDGLAFDGDKSGYRMRLNRRDFTAAAGATLDVALSLDPAPMVYTELFEGRRYFVADLPAPASLGGVRAVASRVGLLWDSSGSGAQRDHGRELALLDAYFRRMRNGEVTLTRLRETAEPPRTYRIVDGDWRALRAALADTPYDGASNLAAFVPDASLQEYLLFSDGLTNFGDAPFPKVGVPLHAIAAAAKSDANFLRQVAERSGGRFIDLARETPEAAAKTLRDRAVRVSSMSALGASQLILASPLPEHGRLLLAGILDEAAATVELRFEGARVPSLQVPVRAGVNTGALAAARWATLSIARLEGEYALNRAEIRRLGQRFRQVTRETSLIVLERAEDYARYEIAPPPELRAEYERVIALTGNQRRDERRKHLEDIVRRFQEKIRWWERDFPKDAPVKIAKIAQAPRAAGLAAPSSPPAPAPSPATVARHAERQESADMIAREMKMAAPEPLGAGAPGEANRRVARAQFNDAAKPQAVGTPQPAPRDAVIRVQKWQPDAPYALRLRNADPADLYRIYLDEKPGYATSTAFFLDAADVFFDKGQEALGIRVLSNLAEMDLENRHILRILGYRLMQAQQPALALPIFRKVLDLSAEEPQSWRDLGLAYAAAGQAQKAVDTLHEVVLRPWHNRFPDVELITLAELNATIATAAVPLDTARIDPRLLRNLPLDLRAVMTWDADNTDIDLWVTDPDGESAYYGHRLTTQGGRMSADFTGGYGPEEFSLKTAKPGKYRVEAKYFGDRRQNLAGATTLSVRLSTRFGTREQRDQVVTMRLKGNGEHVFVGEFEIK